MEQVFMKDVKFTCYSSEFRPVKAHGSDAAYDLYAASDPILKPSKSGLTQYLEYSTGIRLELPPKTHALIMPRSSIRNTDLMMCNTPGLIDSGYRGDVIVCFRILAQAGMASMYKKGDRIAQLMFVSETDVNLKESDHIMLETDRGSNGFGSSGA
jgi:dUTP pyrophosphatase